MLKVTTPSKMPVHNSVDNLPNYPQEKYSDVENWVIHTLYTRFTQVTVDI